MKIKNTIIVVFLLYGIIYPQNNIKNNNNCYPPAWDGVVPGFSLDQDILTIYGKGYFVDTIGHGGGRVYMDSTKSIQMVEEIGVDNIIESIKISLIDNKDKDINKYPISKRLNRLAGFGVYHKLTLESDSISVSNNLGKPNEIFTNNNGNIIWIYKTDYVNTECYADAELKIEFKGNKIKSVLFYNGE
jgi:hypothetical protein